MTILEAIEKYNAEAWGYEIAFQDEDGLIVAYDMDDDYVGKFTLEEFVNWNNWPLMA